MSKKIVITIGDNGSVEVETKGFAGSSCLTETAALEAALGGATKTIKTQEFHQPATQGSKAKASQ
jgi:hypothetical protein